MTSSSARFADLQRKYEENPRRFFAPLANELRRSGNARRAAEICREYLAHLPEHLSGHVVLAQSLADLGEHDEARAAFERVLALDPENVVALRALGDMDAEHGARDEARGWYARLLRVDPRDGEVTTRLATLELPVVPETPAAAAPPGEPADLDAFAPRPSGATIAGDAADWSFAPPAAEGLMSGTADATSGGGDEGPSSPAGRPMREDEDAEEFTAGFFASVLEPERPSAADEPAVDLDAALARPVGDAPDLEPADIDRLLADLPALGEALPPSGDVAAALTPWGQFPGAEATAAPAGPLDVDSPLSPTFDAPASRADEQVPPPLVTTAAEPVPEPLRADDDEDRAAAFGVAAGEPETPAPFVTETMATLYLQQGHRAQALQMYEQLVAQHPDDDALRTRYEALRAEEPAEAPTAAGDEPATEPPAHGDPGERPEGGVQTAAAIVAGAAFAAGVVYTVSGWLRSLVQGEQPGVPVEATVAESSAAPALDAAVVEPSAAAAGAPEGPRDEQPEFGEAADAPAALGAEPADAAWTGEPNAEPMSDRGVTATAVAADAGEVADVRTGEEPIGEPLAAADAGEPMFAPEAEAPIAVDAGSAAGLAPAAEAPADAPDAAEWAPSGLADAEDAVADQETAGAVEQLPPAAEVLDEPWIASDDSDISVAADAGAEETASAELAPADDELLVVIDGEPEPAGDAMSPADGGVAAAEIEDAELVDAELVDAELVEAELVDAELVQAGADDRVDPFAFDLVAPEPALDAGPVVETEPVAEAEPAAETGAAADATAEAAEDPFAWGEPAVEPETAAGAGGWAPAPTEPFTLERFSARPVSHADEVAAGALAAAAVSLQNDAALDAQLREASLDDPTSLELLLRVAGRPSRPNAGYSFDQFFQGDPSRHPADVATPAGHADGGRRTVEDEDREHFHAWLARLSDS